MQAQSRPVDLLAGVGYACGYGDSYCKPYDSGFFTRVSSRLYSTPRWSFQPTFSYLQKGGADRDYLLAANWAVDFGPDERIKPYLVFGAGYLRRTEHGRISNHLTLGVGCGIRAYVSRRIFLAPELGADGMGFPRIGVDVGYTFGR